MMCFGEKGKNSSMEKKQELASRLKGRCGLRLPQATSCQGFSSLAELRLRRCSVVELSCWAELVWMRASLVATVVKVDEGVVDGEEIAALSDGYEDYVIAVSKSGLRKSGIGAWSSRIRTL
jgi:hypothetical protein